MHGHRRLHGDGLPPHSPGLHLLEGELIVACRGKLEEFGEKP